MESTENLPTLSNGVSSRGAQMGRWTYQEHLAQTSVKAQIWEEPIEDGYDRGGAYWGDGKPLYMLKDDDGKLFDVTRAYNVEDAEDYFRQKLSEINIEFERLTN